MAGLLSEGRDNAWRCRHANARTRRPPPGRRSGIWTNRKIWLKTAVKKIPQGGLFRQSGRGGIIPAPQSHDSD